jgi:hypothetical protein
LPGIHGVHVLQSGRGWGSALVKSTACARAGWQGAQAARSGPARQAGEGGARARTTSVSMSDRHRLGEGVVNRSMTPPADGVAN